MAGAQSLYPLYCACCAPRTLSWGVWPGLVEGSSTVTRVTTTTSMAATTSTLRHCHRITITTAGDHSLAQVAVMSHAFLVCSFYTLSLSKLQLLTTELRSVWLETQYWWLVAVSGWCVILLQSLQCPHQEQVAATQHTELCTH